MNEYDIKLSLLLKKYLLLVFFILSHALFEQAVSAENHLPLSLFKAESCYLGDECFRYISEKPTMIDRFLGPVFMPNISFREVFRTESEVIYDKTYKINSFGHRLSARQNGEQKYFSLFLGGSFTFGSGLDLEDSLPSLFAIKNTNFESYNYSISGVGTNTIAALSEFGGYTREINQESGIVVYVFINDHVARATGKLPSLLWLGESPYYSPKSFQREGTLNGHLGWKGKVLRAAYEWLPFLRSRVFPAISEDDYLYTCHLIKKIKDNTMNHFKKSEFLVYFHPFDEPLISESLQRCLKASDIAILKGDHLKDGKYKIPVDGHPNSLTNEIMASELNEYVEKISKFN